MSEERLPGSGGVALAARRWEGGAHVPFLLVHGLASNARMWDGVAEHLSAHGHPVVALDQRGHGRSDKPDQGYDFGTLTDDLLSVLDGLGWERPVAVGQSWGGNVVLELAACHPDRVRAIACVDGGWIELARQYPTWEACAAALAPPVLEGRSVAEMRRFLSDRHPDWPESGIDGFLGNFEARADGTVAPWLTRERHMRILRELWGHRSSARYASVDVPVLLVPATGGESPVGEDLGPSGAAEALPSVRVVGLAGNHDLHAQQPGTLADLLHVWALEVVPA